MLIFLNLSIIYFFLFFVSYDICYFGVLPDLNFVEFFCIAWLVILAYEVVVVVKVDVLFNFRLSRRRMRRKLVGRV